MAITKQANSINHNMSTNMTQKSKLAATCEEPSYPCVLNIDPLTAAETVPPNIFSTLRAWMDFCNLQDNQCTQLELATNDIIIAISRHALLQKITNFTLQFDPFEYHLEVKFSYTSKLRIGTSELFTLNSIQLIDNVSWREELGGKQLVIKEYARRKEHPGELYFLELRPKCADNLHFSKIKNSLTLVTNNKKNTVLSLSDIAAEALQAMDGNTSMHEIFRILVQRHGLFDPKRLGQLINRLSEAEIIILDKNILQATSHASLWEKIKEYTTLRLTLHNCSPFMQYLTCKTGWLFGIRAFYVWVLFILISMLIFNFNLDYYDHVFEYPMQILPSLNITSILIFALCFILVAILHELAHGITCVRNGGNVSKFGILIYYGAVAVYCDTTNSLLFENKWHRIAVSLAGPMSNIIIACFLAWLEIFFNINLWTDESKIIGTLATISLFMGIINLLPVLDLDGYHILSDCMELPNLKCDAYGLLLNRICRNNSSELNLQMLYTLPQRVTLSIYGLISPVFALAVMFLMALKLFLGPSYHRQGILFWYALFLFLATLAQKLATLGRQCYLRLCVREEVLQDNPACRSRNQVIFHKNEQ